MITKPQAISIAKKLTDLFHGATVRTFTEPDGEKITFTVNSLQTSQIIRLATLSVDEAVNLKIKRSGPGLGIHLN